MQKSFVVVIFGPTGTAGSELVRQSLEDPRITEVRAITRRSLGIDHQKLREIQCGNFANLAAIEDSFINVDTCFFCLGISQAQAKGEDHYRQITVGYALEAARVLKEKNPYATFVYLSGGGTDTTGKSWMMWARVKGEAENALNEFGLKRIFNFRPGYIHPERAFAKSGVLSFIARVLFPFFRSVAPGAVIRATELAQGMINVALSDAQGATYDNKQILALANNKFEGTALTAHP